ncbi:MAG: hypothetical protein WCT46_00685 [Candidatus Gracilibacteria bacterium]
MDESPILVTTEVVNEDPRLTEWLQEIATVKESFEKVEATVAIEMLGTVESFVGRAFEDDGLEAADVPAELAKYMADFRRFISSEEGRLVFSPINSPKLLVPSLSVSGVSDGSPLIDLFLRISKLSQFRGILEEHLIRSKLVSAEAVEKMRIVSPEIMEMIRQGDPQAIRREEHPLVDFSHRFLWSIYSRIQAYFVAIKGLGIAQDYLKEKEPKDVAPIVERKQRRPKKVVSVSLEQSAGSVVPVVNSPAEVPIAPVVLERRDVSVADSPDVVRCLTGKRVAVFGRPFGSLMGILKDKGVVITRIEDREDLSTLDVGEYDAVLVLASDRIRRAFLRIVDESIMPVFAENDETAGALVRRLNDEFGKLESKRVGAVKNG